MRGIKNTAAAHTGIQIVFAAKRLPLCASEQKTLIGMDHSFQFWIAPPNSAQQLASMLSRGSLPAPDNENLAKTLP